MNNTAIRAMKREVTRTVTFKDQEHENFYKEHLPRCRYQDSNQKALVCCLGTSEVHEEV